MKKTTFALPYGNCRQKWVNITENETSNSSPANLENLNDIDDVGANENIDNNVETRRARGRPRIIRTGKIGRPTKQYTITQEKKQLLVENNLLNFVCDLPTSVNDAMQGAESKQWKDAMQAEFKSLTECKAWTLVDMPLEKNIIGCRWVFAKKYDEHGMLEKFKARLVAQGCSQKPGEDYTETYSPVVRHTTIRLILALAVQHQLLVNHIDVTTAYLNGILEEDLYMRQPEGFVDKNHPHKVCKLQRSIYGLKQSGRYWNDSINEILIGIGFNRCQADNCVYTLINKDEINIISVYVDDIILACSSEGQMKNIIIKLNEQIKLVDKGPIKYYLGMEIERHSPRGEISIHQNRYIIDLLNRWNMADCNGALTPYSNGTFLEKCTDNDCKGYSIKEYQSLLGGLNYLAKISRPDIAHTTSKLSQFLNHPHKEHFIAAKRVLRYLKQKPKGIITYKFKDTSFLCFSDADWAQDIIDRKSYSGYAIFFGGGLIAWESKKQQVVSLSTMEAEYIAMSNAAREVIFHRNIMKEMGFESYIKAPSKMFCDNQSAQFAIKNPVAHKRSKHIDIKFHYIRQKYMEHEIDIEYVATTSNAADIFTKNLTGEKHKFLCKLLKIRFL